MSLLILASASEQRQKLLAEIGVIPDEVFASNIDENPLIGELPKHTAIRLAYRKAQTAKQHYAQTHLKTAYILSGDTLIACGRRVFAKPKDLHQARQQLNLLSGRAHRAYSAVCLLSPASANNENGKISQKISITRISMKRLSHSEIETYLASNLWQGRASDYHFYGLTASFIRHLSGSPSGVMGLPLFETRQLLHGTGLL